MKNVCQHQELAVEFSGSTIAVIGPNGSGKSNLLNTVYASLTNDWTRLPGGKAANIRYGSKGASHSVVEFSHAGTDCQLVRDLKGKSSCLLVGSGERVTGEDSITARIFDLLQIKDQKVLDDYVFIRQSVSHAFLESTENKRYKAMQYLFDLDKLAKIAEYLKYETKKYVPKSVDAELNDVRLELSVLDRKRLQLAVELEKLPEFDLSAAVEVVSSWNRYQDQEKTRKQTQKELTSCKERIADIERRLQATDDALEVVDQFIKQHEGDYQEFVNAQLVANQFSQASVELRKVDADIAKTEEQLGALPANASRLDIAKLTEDRNEIVGRLARFQSAIDVVDEGKSSCPTCGTNVSDLPIDDFRKQAAKLTREQATIDEKLDNARKYEKLTSALQKLEKQKASLLKAIPEQKPAAMSKELAKEHKEKLAQQRQLEKDAASFRAVLLTEKKMLKTLQASKHEASACSVTLEEFTAAQQQIANGKELAESRQQLASDIAVVKSQITEASKKINKLTSERNTLAKEKSWFDLCSRLSDVFRDLPKIITQHHLLAIEQKMAPIIAAFDATFRVVASDGLELNAIFHDGSEQPCARLSGGQKDVLGLAYYFAVNLMYASSVRLIAMDEPTRFMDDSYVSRMLDVLAGLKLVVDKHDVQCFVVTHEKRLASVFDQVVDVGATL